MLRVLPKFLLVGTAFAPVMLTSAAVAFFKADSQAAAWKEAGPLLVATTALVAICLLVMKLAVRDLPHFEVEIKQIKPADKELIGFVLAYLLPLARGTQFEIPSLGIVLVVFFVVVMTSNAYHTNPLLGMLGWHFYEVIIDDVGYILVSRRNVHNIRSVKVVVNLTDYMVADASPRTL